MLKYLVILAAFLMPAISHSYEASELPKNVQLILSYGPGGVVDQKARHFQQYMSTKGINVQVNYKPGANGVIAMNDLALAPKDGSTILLTAAGLIASSEIQLGHPVADALTVTGITLHSIIAYPKSKYATLASFEEAMKTGDPKLDIGYHAVGNIFLLDQYFFRLGVTTIPLRVPFKTPAILATQVVGGHIQTATVPMAVAMPLAESGQLVILGVIGPSGFKLPQGIVSISGRWKNWKHPDGFMLAAPIGWSKSTTDLWLSVLKTYLNDPATIEFYQKSYLGPAEFGPKHANVLIESSTAEIKRAGQ